MEPQPMQIVAVDQEITRQSIPLEKSQEEPPITETENYGRFLMAGYNRGHGGGRSGGATVSGHDPASKGWKTVESTRRRKGPSNQAGPHQESYVVAGRASRGGRGGIRGGFADGRVYQSRGNNVTFRDSLEDFPPLPKPDRDLKGRAVDLTASTSVSPCHKGKAKSIVEGQAGGLIDKLPLQDLQQPPEQISEESVRTELCLITSVERNQTTIASESLLPQDPQVGKHLQLVQRVSQVIRSNPLPLLQDQAMEEGGIKP
ncbi:hypothetical protein J5N97_026538 [Dioscorea zingiberensis]|uniref:Uncharacterized protein n=1 Tax=Dioscorea zingiberensis TaxID=325984 RepID=A0A9D5H6V9_9LILI|nr:hypothetical protein J5N97_026538 [Dioscorea zingiberensis]